MITGKQRKPDILTNQRIIECKNINWVWVKRKKTKKVIIEQFQDLKNLAQQYNESNKENIRLVISSKQPVPRHWRRWFEQEEIGLEID